MGGKTGGAEGFSLHGSSQNHGWNKIRFRQTLRLTLTPISIPTPTVNSRESKGYVQWCPRQSVHWQTSNRHMCWDDLRQKVAHCEPCKDSNNDGSHEKQDLFQVRIWRAKLGENSTQRETVSASRKLRAPRHFSKPPTLDFMTREPR